MTFLVAAKLVVVAHIGFVAFIFLGARFFEAHRGLVVVHGSCVLYSILITVIDWPCPLTILEQWLLAQAGAPVYPGEFLPHYVWSHFGLTGTEIPVAAGLLLAILAVNFRPYRRLMVE